MRTVVDHFSENGSTVNLCSLDVSKAFDKVNHHVLFTKLMQRKIPVNLIKLLMSWYSNSIAVVNWYGSISKSYRLRSGVRQGGVLSPNLFAVYINSVIITIDESNLGCQVGNLNMGTLIYADDLVLISASVCKLQKMVDLCLNVLTSLDLKVNVKKSACIRIGRDFKHDCVQLAADGTLIPWVPCFTYLGVALISATKFSLDLKPARIKFYRSFNSLYCKISKASEVLIASLVNTFCIPAMMFGSKHFL